MRTHVMTQLSKNVRYDFSVAGSLQQMVADDQELCARLEVVLKLYTRGFYGDVSDDIKAENELALIFGKGLIFGRYLFSSVDVIVTGRATLEDTVDALVVLTAECPYAHPVD